MAYDYKAFISYSHSADGNLAPALQYGLQKFACPWNRLRAIRVFRDKTGLTVTPGLWRSIVTALDASEYFLLLASPQAAQSHWVNQEVQHWLSRPREHRLLIILTEGEIVWDTELRRLDVQRTNALPPSLQQLSEEPLWIDLRWAKVSEQVSLQNPQFREAVADISSTLRGIPKDQLIGDDVRQHRRATLFRRSMITSLIILALGLAMATYVAFQQRDIAREQARIALARQLAAQSELIRTSQPERLPLALLMATEATHLEPDALEAQQSLQAILSQFPAPLTTLRVGEGPINIATDSRLTLLAASSEKATTLWRLPDPQPMATLPPFNHIVLSEEGQLLAGCCHSVEAWTWSGIRKFSLDLSHFSGQPTSIALSRDGNLLAVGFMGRSGPGFEVRNLTTNLVVFRREIALSGNPPALAFAPNGDLAVTLRESVEILPVGASAVTTLASDTGSLTAISYSTDGRYLSWSSIGNIVVFDFQEHKESARLTADSEVPDPQVHRLTFSADGKYLAAVGAMNTGSIWRVANWSKVLVPRHGEFQTISALAFHPSVPEVVTCASDGYCLSWSLTSGQKIRRFAHVHAYEESGNTNKRQIVGAAFADSGARLVTSGADGTVRLWDVTPPGESVQSQCLSDPIIETFAPVGRQWSWPSFSVPIPTAPQCQGILPREALTSTVVRDSSGEYVAFPQPIDVVKIWTPSQGVVATIAHDDPVDWQAAQQRLIARGTSSYRAYLPIIERMKNKGSVTVHALSPSAKYLVTTRESDDTLRIWDVATKRVLFSEQLSPQVDSLFDFLSEERLLRVDRKKEGKGSLAVIDVATATAVWAMPAEWPVAVTTSEDHQLVAWADGRDKQLTLRVQEVATGKLLFERRVEAEAKKLYFDRHHRFLALSVGEQPPVPSGLPLGGGLMVWQIADGKEIATLPEADKVIAFAFSTEGPYFSAVTRDGRMQVWDLDTGMVTRTVLRHPGPLAFSASGMWIAVGSSSVQVLERTSLRPVAQLDFLADVRHMEFQLNDRVLAVSGFHPGDSRGITRTRYWQPADLLAEACKRLPLAAAEAQWRHLFVDRSPPDVCQDSSKALR